MDLTDHLNVSLVYGKRSIPARALAIVLTHYNENVLHVTLTRKRSRRHSHPGILLEDFKYRIKDGPLTHVRVRGEYRIEPTEIKLVLPQRGVLKRDVLLHADKSFTLVGKLEGDRLYLLREGYSREYVKGRKEGDVTNRIATITPLLDRGPVDVRTYGNVDYLVEFTFITDRSKKVYVVIEKKSGVVPFELAQTYIYAQVIKRRKRARVLGVIMHTSRRINVFRFVYDSAITRSLSPESLYEVNHVALPFNVQDIYGSEREFFIASIKSLGIIIWEDFFEHQS